MANLPSNQTAQFPQFNVPWVQDNFTPTVAVYRLLLALWQRTGGTNGISSTDASSTAAQALAIAQSAGATATLALADAQAAQATANIAGNAAGSAQNTANAAGSAAGIVSANALSKALNLSDVQSAATSRTNLAVAVFPITFNFDTVTSGLTRYVPLVRNLDIPVNFIGTLTWAGAVPTADAVFTVLRIRAGVTTTLGTITLIHSGNFSVLSTQPTINLLTGDVLALKCPTSVDATLAYVGITLSTLLA